MSTSLNDSRVSSNEVMKDYLVSILMIESNTPFVRTIAAENRDDARAAGLANWQVWCATNQTQLWSIAAIEVLQRP